MVRQSMILDQYGNPFHGQSVDSQLVGRIRAQIRHEIRASYDGASESAALTNYWANADSLGPNAANSLSVRRKLRNRSRYELTGNNPYLSGTLLTLANDFVGSGPKPQIVDDRLSKDAKNMIERVFWKWCKRTKYRQKLWRLRMAKCFDGEGFKVAYNNYGLRHPIKLDFSVIEADQCTSIGMFNPVELPNETDGVRFDGYGNPIEYYILDSHPNEMFGSVQGRWVPARYVTHWFRQTRGWLRGIPELTASLPLCGLLRRYTLAVVKAAEAAADHAIVLQSEMPPAVKSQYASDPNQDGVFESFPIEQGMMTVLPWGYTMSQIDAKQPIQTYDSFVKSLLREIIRPLMVPFNLASGSSQESNMSSAVVDTHIYKEAQKQDRIHCEEEVLDPDFDIWWEEFLRVPMYRQDPEIQRAISRDYSLLWDSPELEWRWDTIGLDHTDPVKVMTAREKAKENKFLTDRDIQEQFYNRDVDEWRAMVEEDLAWARKNGLMPQTANAQPSNGTPGDDQEDDEDPDE